MTTYVIQFTYVAAAALFILSLKWLGHPTTARRGVRVGELGMVLAIVGTLLHAEIVSYQWILVGFVLGSAIGLPLAVFMPMTHVPQRTALSHAFGALAAALVGTSEYYLRSGELSTFTMAVLSVEVILGFLTFTGSLMAFGKLQDLVPSRPIVYPGQNAVNLSLLAAAVGCAVYLVRNPGSSALFPVVAGLSLLFGVLLLPFGAIPVALAVVVIVPLVLVRTYYGMVRYRPEEEERKKEEVHAERTRNPEGLHCPHCGSTKLWIAADGSAYCDNCKTGTIALRPSV